MDIRKVKKLIELLEESNISEIEIQEGEESVRISVTLMALRGSHSLCRSMRSNLAMRLLPPQRALQHQHRLLKQSLRAQATVARQSTLPW